MTSSKRPRKSPPKTVELREAYVWSCPFCESEFFGRMVVLEQTSWKEAKEEGFAKSEYLVETVVYCPACDQFLSLLPTDEAEDDDLPIAAVGPSWTYDCEHCGRENFVKTEMFEVSEEEIAELIGEYGDDYEQELGSVIPPKRVKCEFCETMFRTKI